MFDGFLDELHSTELAHGRRREVGVASRPGPVARDRLGGERHHHARVLAKPEEDPSGDPKMVAHFDTFARTDLKLPLSRHHFRVRPGDLHTRVEARSGGENGRARDDV